MPTVVIVFVSIWCLAMLIFIRRMWQVHRFRIGLLRGDFDTYLTLPSYEKMVFNFWKPLSSFVVNSGGRPEEQFTPADLEETDDANALTEEEEEANHGAG
ncbi:MAG: hypothetical protein A2Y91_03830 [Chloroflexi bacterium RBG_13_54_8]|nr:MAG: hypothetical protein A2Y91_03830 [Chloroflexi bacterium RBG_13_54_8]